MTTPGHDDRNDLTDTSAADNNTASVTGAPARTAPGAAHGLGDERCCPECGERAVPRAPSAWNDTWGDPPGWSHTDGEPLCPVIGPEAGYQPAQPVPLDTGPHGAGAADTGALDSGLRESGFDLERLDEITGRDGFAAFGPTVPGGVRELSDAERGVLERAAATPDTTSEPATASEPASSATAGPDVPGSPAVSIAPAPRVPSARGNAPDWLRAQWALDRSADRLARFEDLAFEARRLGVPGLDSPAARAEFLATEIERRTGDVDFPYDPAADYGDPGYREPRSEDEAAARTAYLAEHQPATGWSPPPITEVEAALFDTSLDADRASRAHDPDPQLDAQRDRLEALAELRPLPTPHDALDPREHADQTPLAAEAGEDAEGMGRDAGGGDWFAEDRWLLEYLRDQDALEQGSAPEPDQNLDGSDRGDGPHRVLDERLGRLRERVDGLARDTPPNPGDVAGRVDRSAVASSFDDPDEARREQLARWHHDDHPDPTTGHSTRAVGDTIDDAVGAGPDTDAEGWGR